MSQKEQSIYLKHNPVSSLFTTEVALGTPNQRTEMLLDLNGDDTFVFSSRTHSFLTRFDKFYKMSDSETGSYTNMSQLFMSEAAGFYMQSQPCQDLMCVLSRGEGVMCLNEANFLSVVSLSQNFWNTEQYLANVGGILGFKFDDCSEGCTSFWQSEHHKINKLAVELGHESDYEWWYASKGRDLPEQRSSLLHINRGL